MLEPRPPDVLVKSSRSSELDQKGSGINSVAVPEGEILQATSDIPASFSVKGNMMVG